MRNLIWICWILLLPTVVFAAPELKGTPEELTRYLSGLPKTVNLVGEAKLEIQAQSGIITVGIKTEHAQLQTALQKNQALRTDIIAKLTASAIPEENIKGSKFSSTPEYGFFGKKPNNYVVDNVLKITVESETQMQHVAQIVDNRADVFYQGMELKEQDKEKIKTRLLQMALANAKHRQKIYEAELNVLLTPIVFHENIMVHPMPMPAKQLRMMSSENSAQDSSTGGSLSLGEHTYHGSVNIQYQVIPQ